jgi:hypothetical protein
MPYRRHTPIGTFDYEDWPALVRAINATARLEGVVWWDPDHTVYPVAKKHT